MTDLLTLREAAAKLRIGTTRLWELTARGELPTVRLPGGRLVRVQESDLQRFIEKHVEGGDESTTGSGQLPVVRGSQQGSRGRRHSA